MIGVFCPDMTDEQIKAHLPLGGEPFVYWRADLWEGETLGITQAVVIGNYPTIIECLKSKGIDIIGNEPKVIEGNPFTGKRVALVAPAPHITKRSQVNKLKGYDVICRVNLSYPVSANVAKMTTNRTDVWYPSLPIIRGERGNYDKLPKYVRTELNTHEVDASFLPISVIDIDLRGLDDHTGCRNNRGFMAIMDIINSQPKELYITGITFYRGGSYHEGYLPKGMDGYADMTSNTKGKIGNHDPEAQLRYFAQNVAILPNVTMDKELRDVLSEFAGKNASKR